jgi:hypothetical protein
MIKIIWRFIKYIQRAEVQMYGMAEAQIYFIVKTLKLNAKK